MVKLFCLAALCKKISLCLLSGEQTVGGKGGTGGTGEKVRRPPTGIQASDDRGGSDDGLKWLDSGCSLKMRLTGFAEGGCGDCEKEVKVVTSKSWGLKQLGGGS